MFEKSWPIKLNTEEIIGRSYNMLTINNNKAQHFSIYNNQLSINYHKKKNENGILNVREILDYSYNPFINSIMEDANAVDIFLNYYFKKNVKCNYYTKTQMIFSNYQKGYNVCISLPGTVLIGDYMIEGDYIRKYYIQLKHIQLMLTNRETKETETYILDHTYDPFIEAVRRDLEAIGILLDYHNELK